MPKTYNLFISHSWTYSDQYQGLCNLLNGADNFSYKNYSVPKDDPIHTHGTDKELYEAIKDQMRPCHVVLILAGVYGSYSKWISKEIKIAKEEFYVAKPIIAIKPYASTNVSTVVSDAADEIVGWNTNSIVSAIRRWG